LLGTLNWKDCRGVLFVDPYGMAVTWSTLEKIAATRTLDVWYLFPLSGVYRQAAHDFDKVDQSKADSLDDVQGTQAWREHFYSADGQTGLLGEQEKGQNVDSCRHRTFRARAPEKDFYWLGERTALSEHGK
jgi:three-Cys-motif partner protein